MRIGRRSIVVAGAVLSGALLGALLVVPNLTGNKDQATPPLQQGAVTATPPATEDFRPQVFVRLHCVEGEATIDSGVLADNIATEAVEQIELSEPQQLDNSCSVLYNVPRDSRYLTAAPGYWGVYAITHWDNPVDSPLALTARVDSARDWNLVAVELPNLPKGPAWLGTGGSGRHGAYYLPEQLQPPRHW